MIRGRVPAEIASLTVELERNPAAAVQVLRALAADADSDVRDWVVGIAPRLLGKASLPILAALAEDSDADVRTEAMRELLAFEPGFLRRLLPKYLAMLRGDDWMDALEAMWRLTQYREASTIPVLRHLVDAAAHPAVRNHAKVALLVLDGDEQTLLDLASLTDHELMPITIKGLAYLGTSAARERLTSIADGDPHDKCRRQARFAIETASQVRPLGRS